MYLIETQPFGKFNSYKLNNQYSGESAVIIPESGSNLNELTLTKNGRSYQILDNVASFEELLQNSWYKGTVLIPFPNRLDGGAYTFSGKRYQFPINETARNNALHGSLYNKPFKIVSTLSGPIKAHVGLEYESDGKLEGFPFSFKASITYTLQNNGLTCNTVIRNTGSEDFPLGHGWHPYFQTGLEVDNLQLKMPSVEKIEVDDRMLPTGKLSPFNEFGNLETIGHTQLDTGFRLKNSGGIVTTEIYDPEKDITLEIWQETGEGKYNFLQIFTPPHRKSIAIEPMTCNINAFNNGDGLIILEPGEEFSGSFGVRLK